MNKSNNNWVAYYRVSTKRQGLGLDAQRMRVHDAAAAEGATIVAEYQEKESGTTANRRQLNMAIAEAKTRHATLVVAKHDRLSRDLGDASELIFKRGVGIKILNLPDEATTDPLLFGVYFGMAMKEARLISERTKAALAAKKAQGVKLGRPNAKVTDKMRDTAAVVNRTKAAENANNVASTNAIKRIVASNKTTGITLQMIADELTARGHFTSRGGYHTPKSVSLLCKREGITLPPKPKKG